MSFQNTPVKYATNTNTILNTTIFLLKSAGTTRCLWTGTYSCLLFWRKYDVTSWHVTSNVSVEFKGKTVRHNQCIIIFTSKPPSKPTTLMLLWNHCRLCCELKGRRWRCEQYSVCFLWPCKSLLALRTICLWCLNSSCQTARLPLLAHAHFLILRSVM